MYFFFYSNNCQYCRKFFKVLKGSGQDQFFENISADKQNGVRNPMIAKYGVREVPSIFVDEKLYAGKQAFAWLESMVKRKSVPSMDSRANRVDVRQRQEVPELSGYSRGDAFCVLGMEQRINTPQEGDGEIDKGTFMLPQVSFDSIESENVSKPVKNSGLEDLESERSRQDKMLFANRQQF